MNFSQLIDIIRRKSNNKHTFLIGIDGCGGSGKSTLADKIKESFVGTKVVHMDDFYLPSSQRNDQAPSEKPIGADVDWMRMLSQVLKPISEHKDGRYQRYDWETDALAEWHTVPNEGIVLIEGVYSTREELRTFYDFTIWVETPRKTRLMRGLERDGEESRSIWEDNWMIAEDKYVNDEKPHEKADVRIKGV